jgi:uroporphyrinogen-III decarboxylase
MNKGQPFEFVFSDSLLAEAGHVSQKDLHFDVEAICKAYEAIKPIAKRLEVEAPQPRLAEFTYTHIAALGAKIAFTEYEPKPEPMLRSPEEIDALEEPDNYLQADLIRERLRTCTELKRRIPGSPSFIGHLFEGPVTSASLLLGQRFLTLPYDDPARAHRLLQFCAISALNYARRIIEYFGERISAFMSGGFPDDFAGIFGPNLFKEFVVPYWEQIYQGMNAGQRMLHSELLRVEHLPFLKQVKVDYFDPGVDQYLTPELLRAHCPTDFQCRITEWEVRDLDAKALQMRYRYLAEFKPYSILFEMTRLQDEPKIEALLEVARLLKGAA